MDNFDRLRLVMGGGIMGDAISRLLIEHNTIYGALIGMTLAGWFLYRNKI